MVLLKRMSLLRFEVCVRTKSLHQPHSVLKKHAIPSIEAELRSFRNLLLSKSLSSSEKRELTRLRDSIENQLPGLAEREEDRALERKLWQRMKDRSATDESRLRE